MGRSTRLSEAGFVDLNCDGALDAFDIELFIDAMPDYRIWFPDRAPMLADMNEDGAVDAFDVEPFVGLLAP